MANQRMIAAALGMTQSTVARALQGSPLVNAETRRRVEEAARELGYRPNPLVTALMEHIRTGKKVRDRDSIAILVPLKPAERKLPEYETFNVQYEGIVHRAAHLGYRAELFSLTEKGMSDEAIDRILYTRGFPGIIIGSVTKGRTSLNLKFERYALASVSSAWIDVPVDRASSDHYANVSLAFGELLGRGYQRIGLVLPPIAFELNGNQWLAGYLNRQHYLHKAHRIPVFEGSVHTCAVEKFRRWYERWKPEVILCLVGEELQWFQEMGLSVQDGPGLVCLNRPLGEKFAGVEENNFLVGALMCDIVINHIIHNERGLPEFPRMTRIKGIWHEGETLPKRRKKTGRGRL